MHYNRQVIAPDHTSFFAGRPKAALLFWFLVGLRCGVRLCLAILVRYNNRKKGKNRFLNVSLSDDHLYGKWLFTWLSLAMSLMVSYFVLTFLPRDVLDEIWD